MYEKNIFLILSDLPKIYHLSLSYIYIYIYIYISKRENKLRKQQSIISFNINMT